MTKLVSQVDTNSLSQEAGEVRKLMRENPGLTTTEELAYASPIQQTTAERMAQGFAELKDAGFADEFRPGHWRLVEQS